jgi:ribosomal protein S18 acetylase RimI-like enzyme
VDYTITNLASTSPNNRQSIVEKVRKIERKTFPSSEAFDFTVELKKNNINTIIALKKGEPAGVIGYLVYARTRKVAFLHKICVTESMRGKGVGKSLVHSLLSHLTKGGCHSIQLWVDEEREPARALYQFFGFKETERRLDYYAPGRHGLKMQLVVEE